MQQAREAAGLANEPRRGLDEDDDELALAPHAAGGQGRRDSNESRSAAARNHPLYEAKAGEDGHYHCPWPECTQHRATSLKCNYE